MTHVSYLRCIAVVAPLALVAAVSACSDDDLILPTGELPDAGVPAADAGTADARAPEDAGVPPSDAAPDAAPEPTISRVTGSTGYVRVFNDAVFAEFYEDDTIVRASNAPECVVHVRSQSKPASPAGTLTIAGPVVGAEGGPDAPITIEPDPDGGNQYMAFADPVFPAGDALQVWVEGTATESFPVMPAQVLRPPPADVVAVTAPAADADGALLIDSAAPLAIAWTPPAAPQADARMVFEMTGIDDLDTSKIASLFCSFPLAAGSATIPANLLAEVRAQVGGTGSATGFVKAFAGGAKEFTGGGVSYFLEVGRPDLVGLEVYDAELK